MGCRQLGKAFSTWCTAQQLVCTTGLLALLLSPRLQGFTFTLDLCCTVLVCLKGRDCKAYTAADTDWTSPKPSLGCFWRRLCLLLRELLSSP